MASKNRFNVYSIDGTVKRSVDRPPVFSTPSRPDLIRKNVKVLQSRRRQPYAPYHMAGKEHPVSTWGKGRGVARVQRLTQGRKAAESPNNVGGRRAHPPTLEKRWALKMNDKEARLARLSALAATASVETVAGRGHRFKPDLTVPVIVEDEFEAITSTKEVLEVLTALGVADDIQRSKDGTKVRAGKGKMRGRRYKRPRSLLMVVSSRDAPLCRGCANLPGVDVTTPGEINTEMLAPGGDPGRLTLMTASAFKEIGGWKE